MRREDLPLPELPESLDEDPLELVDRLRDLDFEWTVLPRDLDRDLLMGDATGDRVGDTVGDLLGDAKGGWFGL